MAAQTEMLALLTGSGVVVPGPSAYRVGHQMTPASSGEIGVKDERISLFPLSAPTTTPFAVTPDPRATFSVIPGNGRVPVAQGNNATGSVDGAIQEVDENFVKCNLYTKPNSTAVLLPRALFPENIQYGSPISLRISDVDGIRTPVIELRDPKPEDNPAALAELDQLLANLP